MGSAGFGVAYLLITVLCVGLSAFSTFVGLHDYTRELTVASTITVVVTAGLLTCDLSIPGRRRQGHGIVGLVFLLLMFTAASWAFNFHFFYKLAMAGDLANARLELSSKRFDDNLAGAITALKSQQHLGKVRDEIDQGFVLLREQIDNRLNKGFGLEANKEADKIEALAAKIPAQITKITRPNRGAIGKGVDDYIADLRRMIYGALERAEKSDPWSTTIASLQGLQAKKANLLKIAASRETDNAGELIKQTSGIGQLSLEAERLTTQAFANKQGVAPPKFESIDAKGIDMNSMPVSMQIALATITKQSPDWQMFAKTVAAGAFALFVDLMPLIMALVLIPRGKRNEDAPIGAPNDSGFEWPTIITSKDDDKKKRPGILNKMKG